MDNGLIRHLKNRLRQPLPGRKAHLEMAHATRRLYESTPADARQAGVLAALFPKNGEWHILLIERQQSSSPDSIRKERHSGQIALPGGKFEPEDESMLDTALRETEEEVGIPRQSVKILGALSDVYIPVSNFQVHPFVGWLESPPAHYLLQEDEVSGVLEVPFAHFQNPATVGATDIRVSPNLTLKNVPYFDVYGKILWGATAMMLGELAAVAGRG